MLKKILVLSAAVMAMLASAAGPAASQDPGYPDTAVLEASIDDTTVVPGQTVTIAGVCDAGDEVVIAIVGEGTIGTIAVGDDDSFSGDVTIPSDLDAGSYTVTASCGDADVVNIDITVSNAGANAGGTDTGGTDNGGALARTGSSSDTLLKAGGGLLLAGAAALLFATKRRSATA